MSYVIYVWTVLVSCLRDISFIHVCISNVWKSDCMLKKTREKETDAVSAKATAALPLILKIFTKKVDVICKVLYY